MLGSGLRQRRGRRFRRAAAVVAIGLVAPVSLAACGSAGSASGVSSTGVVSVVAAENQYGNVAEQIGGRYVHVVSVESNPNTDPHTYEVSPDVAREVSGARLAIQNGVGYDSFMNKIEGASPNSKRRVIDVQNLLGLPDSTPNPHLWYDPKTMPAAAKAMGYDLAAIDPAHAAYFRANVVSSTLRSVRGSWPSPASKPGTGDDGGHHRASGRLPPPGHGGRQPDAVPVPGGHHERHRPDPAGRDAGERFLLPAQGQGFRLQPAGGRLAHRVDEGQRAESWCARWSASTRRCPSPATTTSRGCWPRPGPSRTPWSTRRRRCACDRRCTLALRRHRSGERCFASERPSAGAGNGDPRRRGGQRVAVGSAHPRRRQLLGRARASSPG